MRSHLKSENFFAHRVVNLWNSLPYEVLCAEDIASFERTFNSIRLNLMLSRDVYSMSFGVFAKHWIHRHLSMFCSRCAFFKNFVFAHIQMFVVKLLYVFHHEVNFPLRSSFCMLVLQEKKVFRTGFLLMFIYGGIIADILFFVNSLWDRLVR